MPLIGMAGSSVMMLNLTDAMSAAAEAGFDAFELFAEFPQCVSDEVTEDKRAEAKKLTQSSGLAVAVHAPFTSLNIAALNPGIRAESVRQTLAAVDLCADIGGKRVVMHNGRYILPRRMTDRAPEAFKLQRHYNIESLKRVASRAEERDVIICLENIGFESDSIDRGVDDMLAIREEVNSPALAFCIDIGHARLNGELPRVIEKMGPPARHIHFTDNFGERDDHVVIGDGNFDYTPHLDFFRNFPDIITLEVFNIGTDPEPAIRSLERVRKMLA